MHEIKSAICNTAADWFADWTLCSQDSAIHKYGAMRAFGIDVAIHAGCVTPKETGSHRAYHFCMEVQENGDIFFRID